MTLTNNHNQQLKTAIILAAGPTSPSLQAIFGPTSVAMLPVNGRPTIHWSLHYLLELGIKRVVIGVRERDSRLQRFVVQAFSSILEVVFVTVSEDRGPGFTLLSCFRYVPESEPCLIVLGDTLFSFANSQLVSFDENFVLISPVNEAYRWCLAEVGPEQKVIKLIDKPAENSANLPALIGVYHLAETFAARDALAELDRQGSVDIQLRHALQPYVMQGSLKAYLAGEWHDCGNIDRLFSSRRHLLQQRAFNHIQIDEVRGTITKRSSEHEKLLNEINYYRLLPSEIAIFFPRCVGYSVKAPDIYLTLEYYGYPTLSEFWVFEEFNEKNWTIIFSGLRPIIDCFGEYAASLDPEASFDFYWGKTLDRLKKFSNQSPDWKSLVEADSIRINGKIFAGWNKIASTVQSAVCDLARTTQGQVLHGDFCFPNILYDRVSGLFKLIDPRGSFLGAGIFGDARYDGAKLLHSIHGGYDFLIHDMFSVKHSRTNIELQQFFPETREMVLNVFSDRFSDRFNISELKLIEGLLFISMCPLHADSAKRQVAMFAIGIQILNELFPL